MALVFRGSVHSAVIGPSTSSAELTGAASRSLTSYARMESPDPPPACVTRICDPDPHADRTPAMSLPHATRNVWSDAPSIKCTDPSVAATTHWVVFGRTTRAAE